MAIAANYHNIWGEGDECSNTSLERTFLNEIGNFFWDFKAYFGSPKKLLLKNQSQDLRKSPTWLTTYGFAVNDWCVNDASFKLSKVVIWQKQLSILRAKSRFFLVVAVLLLLLSGGRVLLITFVDSAYIIVMKWECSQVQCLLILIICNCTILCYFYFP